MPKNEYWITTELDTAFVQQHNDYECYALVNSRKMAETQDENKMADYGDSSDAIEGLVKISHNCKAVYRKCKARNGLKGNEVALGYRTLQKLGLPKGAQVKIKPTCWFCYLWHHYESVIKWPFRFAVVSLLITLVGAIFSIISFAQNI